MLLPVISAQELARRAYRKFERGDKVIVPGWFYRIALFVRRFVPEILLLPFVGLLFRVRDEEGNLQWPKPLSDATPTTSRSGAKAKTKERTGASGADER
jgi:hypothetical protein